MFRSRWFRNTLLTLAILLLVVGIVLVSGYFRIRGRGERHQAQVLAELDAKEPGWRFEQIQAARQATLPPPDKNVMEQAVKLADRFPELEYRNWLRQEYAQPDPPRSPGSPPTEDEVAHARNLTELCHELIPEARTLRHLSGGVIVALAENPIATPLPHLDKAGRVVNLLQYDATVAAVEGRTEDAVTDALAILAIARGLDAEPYIVSQMFRLRLLGLAVRVVQRALRLGEASDATLAEVQVALEASANVQAFVTGLRGERAGMSKLADLLAKDPGQADGLLTGKTPPKVVTTVAASTLLPETHARYLELLTRAIEIAQKPPGPERNAEFAKIDADVKADTSLEGQALRLVVPAVLKCYEADVRTTALLHALTAGVKYHLFPRGRGNVIDWVIHKLPTDPYTGKPLLFKLFDDGIAVYSTGPDKTDDGGTNLTDGGTRAGSDWGVRLYNTKKR